MLCIRLVLAMVVDSSEYIPFCFLAVVALTSTKSSFRKKAKTQLAEFSTRILRHVIDTARAAAMWRRARASNAITSNLTQVRSGFSGNKIRVFQLLFRMEFRGPSAGTQYP